MRRPCGAASRRRTSRRHPASSERLAHGAGSEASKTKCLGFHHCCAATRQERCTRLHPAGADSRHEASSLRDKPGSSRPVMGPRIRQQAGKRCNNPPSSILSSLICNRLSSDLHRQSCSTVDFLGKKKSICLNCLSRHGMLMIRSLHFSVDDGSRLMARREIDGETNIVVIHRQEEFTASQSHRRYTT